MHREKKATTMSGGGMLFLNLALLIVSIIMFVSGIKDKDLLILFTGSLAQITSWLKATQSAPGLGPPLSAEVTNRRPDGVSQ